MITLIQRSEAHRSPTIIADMHRLRARVFHDRLKWDVSVHDGQERDQFDDCDPLYVISQDETGRVRGSARLLPSTGPNMLNDVFSELLPDGEPVRAPNIWEGSRFSVDRQDLAVRSEHAINYVTAEILLAEAEIGQLVGLDFIVSVVDVHMERVLNRAGCPCERIGQPKKIGKVTAIAGLWAIGDKLIDSLRSASGITSNVLPSEEYVLDALAA